MALDQKTRVSVALALIALALIIAIIQFGRGCHHKAEARRGLMRPFWCENCRKEFMAPWRDITTTCPDCREQTSVVRCYYVCSRCGTRFHAYDFNLSTQEMRLDGAEWGPSIYPLPEFECPKCHSRETALEKYNRR